MRVRRPQTPLGAGDETGWPSAGSLNRTDARGDQHPRDRADARHPLSFSPGYCPGCSEVAPCVEWPNASCMDGQRSHESRFVSAPKARLHMTDMPANDAPFRLIDDVEFGEDVIVWSFSNLYGCRIGSHPRIGSFVEVQRGASICAACKISSHSFICDGVEIEDEVFVGHGVLFINDRFPRATTDEGASKTDDDWTSSEPWWSHRSRGDVANSSAATRALHGPSSRNEALFELAASNSLEVVEDAAQAHGTQYDGRPCGSLGQLACFSFYPGKNLGAYGDGGMVTTSDTAVVERTRRLRNYGERAKYDHVVKGVNSRLDGLQAAFLSVKLPHLPSWNEARLRHADRYTAQLDDIGDLALQQRSNSSTHVYHLFIVETAERDALRDFLTERGIQTGIHYPIPIHLQEAYNDLGLGPGYVSPRGAPGARVALPADVPRANRRTDPQRYRRKFANSSCRGAGTKRRRETNPRSGRASGRARHLAAVRHGLP
jgi:hypothetical protein